LNRNNPISDNSTNVEQVPTDSNPDNSVSRAAIYARTSVKKPDNHYSIDEQARRCWKQCKKQNWDVVFVFTDEAESGRNTERPEFQKMLEKAEQGCFDVVVFWKLDRFCRSVVDLVKTEEQLNQCDVALQSATEYIDTASPVGRFTFRNLASAVEMESDLTSQRVRVGMHAVARKHRWPNDHPPVGYVLASDQTLSIIDREAELDTCDSAVVEIMVYAELLSMLVSRGLLGLVTKVADDQIFFPPERWAATLRSHAQIILSKFSEFLGYSPQPLLERLIEDAQKIH